MKEEQHGQEDEKYQRVDQQDQAEGVGCKRVDYRRNLILEVLGVLVLLFRTVLV